MDYLSLSESNRRWQVLLQRHDQAPAAPAFMAGAKRKASSRDNDVKEDPFDCQSIAIPPVRILVDGVIEDFAERWKQLDYRKIVVNPEENASPQQQQQGEDGNDQEENAGQSNKKRKKISRENRHLILPPQFDYATRLPEPPADNGGDRVVNLLNPSETFPYEQELWKLFQSVPTLEDIEEQVAEGRQLLHTQRACEEIEDHYTQISSADGHALARLRNCNRHGMIPLPRSAAKSTTISTGKQLALNEAVKTVDNSTIRFECWRGNTRKFASTLPDPDRAVLEFLGSQTLADVHATIVELMEDVVIWETSSSLLSSQSDKGNTEKEDPQNNTPETPSGCFFIEDKFYTIGSVDYATQIQQWLAVSDTRKAVLRIPTSQPLSKIPMSETKLKDIPWRLNIRYQHVHRGDVECSVFVTDLKHGSCITTNSSAGKQQSLSFPLIHDYWPPGLPTSECEACQKLAVSVRTPTRCAISQGYRALCFVCAKRLLRGKGAINTGVGTD